MKRYKITRTGQVTNSGICGEEGDTELSYRVEIEILPPLSLNTHGFLIDHDEIHNIVSGYLALSTSCELACINALSALKKYVKNFYVDKDRFILAGITIRVGMVDGNAYFTGTDR